MGKYIRFVNEATFEIPEITFIGKYNCLFNHQGKVILHSFNYLPALDLCLVKVFEVQ